MSQDTEIRVNYFNVVKVLAKTIKFTFPNEQLNTLTPNELAIRTRQIISDILNGLLSAYKHDNEFIEASIAYFILNTEVCNLLKENHKEELIKLKISKKLRSKVH